VGRERESPRSAARRALIPLVSMVKDSAAPESTRGGGYGYGGGTQMVPVPEEEEDDEDSEIAGANKPPFSLRNPADMARVPSAAAAAQKASVPVLGGARRQAGAFIGPALADTESSTSQVGHHSHPGPLPPLARAPPPHMHPALFCLRCLCQSDTDYQAAYNARTRAKAVPTGAPDSLFGCVLGVPATLSSWLSFMLPVPAGAGAGPGGPGSSGGDVSPRSAAGSREGTLVSECEGAGAGAGGGRGLPFSSSAQSLGAYDGNGSVFSNGSSGTWRGVGGGGGTSGGGGGARNSRRKAAGPPATRRKSNFRGVDASPSSSTMGSP